MITPAGKSDKSGAAGSIDAEEIARKLAAGPELSPQQRALLDAGSRLADAHNLALTIGAVGRWIAARLTDGGTDGSVYDSKADAVRHQLHETQCAYVCVQPMVMPPSEAARLIEITRQAYDANFRVSDPEDWRQPIPTGGIPGRMGGLIR